MKRHRTLVPGLMDILGLIFIMAFLLIGRSLAGDPGVGWHLKAGEIISKNSLFSDQLAAVREDPFLLESTSPEWINNQWFSDFLFYKTYSIGGWDLLDGIVVLTVIVAYIFLLGSLLNKSCFSPLVVFFVIFLSAFQGAVQWFVRPVLFSFLLFTYTYVLINYRIRHGLKSAPALVCLFLTFLLWANLHPAFVLGLVLIALAGVSEYFQYYLSPIEERNQGLVLRIGFWLLAFLVCLVATFLTPFRLDLWHNIFGLAGNQFFMNLNSEWFSTDIYSTPFKFYFLSFFLLFSLFLSDKRRRLRVFDWALLIIFTYFSLIHRRYVPFFGIVLTMPLAELLQSFWSQWRSQSGKLGRDFLTLEMKQVRRTKKFYTSFALVALLVWKGVSSSETGEELYSKRFPKESVAHLKESAPGKIFHTPNWGGYLTWSLWPKQKAWIDDRNQLNGQAKYEDFLSLDRVSEDWQTVLSRHKFDWLLLEKGSRLNKLFQDSAVAQSYGFKQVVVEEHGALYKQEGISR